VSDGQRQGLGSSPSRVIRWLLAVSALAVLALWLPSMAGARELRFRGCISADERTGPEGSDACQLRIRAYTALTDMTSLVLSPEQRSLYSGTSLDCRGLDNFRCTTEAAVGNFRLKRKNRALRYRDCVTGARNNRGCAPVTSATRNAYHAGLGHVTSIAISPDNAFLYAVSRAPICTIDDGTGERICHGSAALTTFERNPRTGHLTYVGCITGDEAGGPAGSGACAAIPSATANGAGSGLSSLTSVVLSRDGKSLYVGVAGDDAVAAFQRNPITGALTYLGCITGNANAGPAGSGACTAIPSATGDGRKSGMDSVSALAVSPDGEWLYAASAGDWSIARLDRDPRTGALTYDGCQTGKTSVNDSGACVLFTNADAQSALRRASSLAISPNGKSVYVAGRGIGQFDRFPASGGLEFVRRYPHAFGPFALTDSGRFLYASIHSGVERFRRHVVTGRLTRTDCVTGSTHFASRRHCRQTPSATPTGKFSGLDSPVALAATSRRVYVAADQDSAVARLAMQRRR
jgi:6-phosphogluconolactonase (cycloisomerase 2 family)